MTFTIKTRGAPGLIVSEFACPECGVFEATVPSGTECWSCECGLLAPWTPSAPRIKHPIITGVVRGKSDGPPTPTALNTEPIADGMPMYKFDEMRAKVWEEHRERKIKKQVA